MDGVKYSYIIAYILWDGCIDEWMDGVKYSYIAYILWDGWMNGWMDG